MLSPSFSSRRRNDAVLDRERKAAGNPAIEEPGFLLCFGSENGRVFLSSGSILPDAFSEVF
jgi:hypothetical protein